MKPYAEIREETLSQLCLHSEIPVSQDDATLRHAHAIILIRLTNSPGFWNDDQSKDRAKDFCIDDIKADFSRRGIEDKLKRWATRKAIELLIDILQSYLKHEFDEHYDLPGMADASSTFSEDCGKCQSEAQRYLDGLDGNGSPSAD